VLSRRNHIDALAWVQVANQGHIYASHDRGESWAALAIVGGQYWSNLFVRDDGVYLLGTSSDGYAGEGSIAISRSTDSGATWQRQVPCINVSTCCFCSGGVRTGRRDLGACAKVPIVTRCPCASRSLCQPQTQQQAAMRRVPRRCWCRTAACGGDWSSGHLHTGQWQTITNKRMPSHGRVWSSHGP
jgi:hypothetical protein